MISFIRNLVGVKTDRAVQASVEALVRWDPQAATEAELRTMEQHLDDLGLQVAQARATYEREKKEAATRVRLQKGELGLDIRAGIHTGEVELVANRVEGIAVHIGARVAAEAKPCELLVSSIVRDLAAGSSIEFEDRGVRTLKGVPGDWQLFAARLSDRAGLR